MIRLVAVAGVALVLAGTAQACAHPASLAKLEGEVMCPVCNTTLDQSDSPAARQIEGHMQGWIRQCLSERQITGRLVAQYGQAILAQPSKQGFDLLAWVLPFAGLAVSALAIGAAARRWSRRSGGAEPPVEASRNGHAGLDPELERRLDQELARFE